MLGFIENAKTTMGAALAFIGLSAAASSAVAYFASAHELQVARCYSERKVALIDAFLTIKTSKDEITKIRSWMKELESEGERRANYDDLLDGFKATIRKHDTIIERAEDTRHANATYISGSKCEEEPVWG